MCQGCDWPRAARFILDSRVRGNDDPYGVHRFKGSNPHDSLSYVASALEDGNDAAMLPKARH